MGWQLVSSAPILMMALHWAQKKIVRLLLTHCLNHGRSLQAWQIPRGVQWRSILLKNIL